MAFGNLHSFLSPKLRRNQPPVAWHTRVGMGVDVACGLAFLHQQSPAVLHLDIKSPNLLVDNQMRVKLADFGLAMYKPEDGGERRQGNYQV